MFVALHYAMAPSNAARLFLLVAADVTDPGQAPEEPEEPKAKGPSNSVLVRLITVTVSIASLTFRRAGSPPACTEKWRKVRRASETCCGAPQARVGQAAEGRLADLRRSAKDRTNTRSSTSGRAARMGRPFQGGHLCGVADPVVLSCIA